MIQEIQYINTFSFVYSPRPGTPASNDANFNHEESKKRLKTFQNFSNLIKKQYRKKLLNTEAVVLFENKMKDNVNYFGRDEFQNSVVVKSKLNLIGKSLTVKINKFNINTLFAEVVDRNYKAA